MNDADEPSMRRSNLQSGGLNDLLRLLIVAATAALN
jgi:hypothetical protein